jgi:hypothetical protein
MTAPMRPDDRADPERDAWLREALRHAPDAQAAPPTAVSDAILRQARAAASAAPAAASAAARGRWAQAWAWLARPPVAAGFASVMIATVVGLMWWGQPIDPHAPPAPAASAEPGPRDAAPAGAADARLRTVEPAPAKKPAPAKPAPPAAPPAPSPTAPMAAPAPAPIPLPALESADNRAAAGKGLAESSAQPVSRSASWAEVLASIRAEPQRWHWQRNGLAQPMTPKMQRWLAQFDAATVGRWRRTDEAAPAQAGRVLRQYRDGAPTATLRFDAEHAWSTPDTHAAALPAATVDQLLQDLDGAAP